MTNVKRPWIIALSVTVGIVVVLTVLLTVAHVYCQPQKFMDECKTSPGRNRKEDCETILNATKQAKEGCHPCYAVIAAFKISNAFTDPFEHSCDKTMLWSQTEDLVNKYTKTKACTTLGETTLGIELARLTKDLKDRSIETGGTHCKETPDIADRPHCLLWDRASEKFAEYACGEVTVMLDGSTHRPFNNKSTLARIEIGKLQPPKVTKLNVILVTGQGSRIEACSSSSHEDCRACLVDSKLNNMSDDTVKLARLICLELVLISLQMLLIH